MYVKVIRQRGANMKYPIKHGGKGLPRISLTDYRFDGKKLLQMSEKSSIFQLQDGSVLKVFSPQYQFLFGLCGGDLETKIMSTEKKRCIPEIMSPECGVYDRNRFAGYVMPRAKGISLSTYFQSQTKEERENLEKYAVLFERIEKVVQKGNALGYVFPDLCSLENIFLDEKGNIQLVDYDGIQIGNHIAIEASTALGNQEIFMHSKYRNQKLFTPELDKLSLLFLYFTMTFQVDLGMVGQKNPYTGKTIELMDILQYIRLDEKELIEKIKAILSFQELGDYFSSSAYQIASSYQLEVEGPIGDGKYLKRLVRK